MQVVPILDQPNQQVQITLGGQNCQLEVYQQTTGLYCNVYVNNSLIVGGVICQNLNRIVRDAYLGFIGDLCFNDTQGSSDPSYPGLGTRYQFLYLQP